MDLPLHGGSAPGWLVGRMKKLARAISDIMIDEYGPDEYLRRLSNPDWFQAMSCVLAFDWHSSGTTTVLCGVLKSILDPEEHGMASVGGKGSRARRSLEEIENLQDRLSLHSSRIRSLRRSSRLSAKVDSALVQDGFGIYHHSMFIVESGEWAVIQQGMNAESRMARRYHWQSSSLDNFVEEPHVGIACDKRAREAMDLTSGKSEKCREQSLKLATGGRGQLMDDMARIRKDSQRSLLEWTGVSLPSERVLPPRINWGAMDKIYDFNPRDYEQLLLVRGLGPSTVRALALVSDLIYGQPPSWEDPVKYSYTFGGKDGVPYPVNRESYDESIEILENAVKDSSIGDRDKMRSLKRLKEFIPTEMQGRGRSWKG